MALGTQATAKTSVGESNESMGPAFDNECPSGSLQIPGAYSRVSQSTCGFPRIMKLFNRGLLIGAISVIPLLAQSLDEPQLSVRQLGGDQLQVAWPAAFRSFTLETAEALSEAAVWQPITITPPQEQGE